jgi:hypothetical protein
MLFKTEEKKVTVGNSNIGEVVLTSFRYITVVEAKFIEDFEKLQEPVRDEILKFSKEIAPKIKEQSGDIIDCFYYNTANSQEIRKKLISHDAELYAKFLEKLQKVTDQNSALKPYTMLKFRSSPEVQEKIKEFLPEDLLIPGKVLTKALLIELIDFYKCESDGIDYVYNPQNSEDEKSDASENFT